MSDADEVVTRTAACPGRRGERRQAAAVLHHHGRSAAWPGPAETT
jgi:hypothetical protein